MSLNLGTLVAAIKLETKQFNQELDDITRRFDRFLEVGTKVANGLTKAFMGFIETGIDTQNMLDANTRSFANLTGSMAKAEDFMGKLKSFAIATPFDVEGLAASTKMLSAMGIKLEATLPLVQVFGDQAAAAGGSADNVKLLAIAFSQVMGAGKLGGQELNQFVNNGVQMLPILTKAYGKSAGEIRDMMRNGMLDARTVLTAILKSMVERTEGQMASMNNTFSGRLSSIREAFKMASAEAVKPLYDQLISIMPVAAVFGLVMIKAATAFIPYLQMALNVMANLMLAFVGLDETTQKWIIGLTLVGAAVTILVTALATVIFTVAATIAAFVTFFTFVSTTALGIIAIVFGMAQAFLAFAAIMTSVAIIIFGVWNSEWFQPIKGAIIAFKDLFVQAGQFCVDQWLIVFKGLYKQVVFIFDGIFDSLMRTIEGFAKSVQKMAGGLFRNVPGPAWWKEDILNAIGALDELQLMTQNWREGDLPSMMQGAVGTVVTQLPGIIGDGMDQIGTYYGDLVKDLLPGNIKDTGAALLDQFNAMTALPPVDVDQLLKDLFGDMDIKAGDGGKAFQKSLKEFAGDVTAEWYLLKRDLDNAELGTVLMYHAQQLEQVNWDGIKTGTDLMVNALKVAATDLEKAMQKFVDLVGNAQLEQSNKITGGLGLEGITSSFESGKNAFGGALGADLITDEAGTTLGMGGLGASLGGIIGVIIELITKTQAFAEVMGLVNEIMDHLVAMLDDLLVAVGPIVNVVGGIVNELLNSITPIFRLLGKALAPLGAVLVPLQSAFSAIATIISSFAQVLIPLVGIFNIAFEGLFYAISGISLVVTAVAYAIGTVWNAIVNVIVDVLSIIAKIPGVGKVVDAAISALENTLVNTQSLEDNMTTILNTSWEEAQAQAQAQADATLAVEETTEALETMTAELINVPDGYKVALARFEATMAVAATQTQAARQQQKFAVNTKNRNSVIPHLARGGIVTSPTVALIGEAGPEAVVPLGNMGSSGTSTSIHIENLVIYPRNYDDFVEQLDRITTRRNFLRTGTPLPSN